MVVRGKCETLEGVREFHRAFGCHTAPSPGVPELTQIDRDEVAAVAYEMEMTAGRCLALAERAEGRPANQAFLRLQLIQEELSELARALEHGNIYEALDGLTDIQYVLDGTYLALGLADLKLPAFREVQRSNMTKLGTDGRPIINAAGRVVKGPNFEKTKLKELMYRYFFGGKI